MAGKFETALKLGGACWKVLMLDKEMMVFPVLSLASVGLLIGAIFAPMWVWGDMAALRQMFESNPDAIYDPRLMAAGFLTYFVIYFAMTFFNAALLTCAMIRLAGGDPTVMDGLRSSFRNLPQIFFWALFTSSIGFAISMIASRFKGLMNFMVRLLGAAWAVASYFAIPVLVVEGVGPVSAVKRSVEMIRRTWGEALIAHVGLTALQYISAIGMVPLIFFGMLKLETDPTLGFFLLGAGIAWMFASMLVITTLEAILKAALYVYAFEGKVPAHFDSHLVRDAFRDE